MTFALVCRRCGRRVIEGEDSEVAEVCECSPPTLLPE